jgi:hypothetical protein
MVVSTIQSMTDPDIERLEKSGPFEGEQRSFAFPWAVSRGMHHSCHLPHMRNVTQMPREMFTITDRDTTDLI